MWFLFCCCSFDFCAFNLMWSSIHNNKIWFSYSNAHAMSCLCIESGEKLIALEWISFFIVQNLHSHQPNDAIVFISMRNMRFTQCNNKNTVPLRLKLWSNQISLELCTPNDNGPILCEFLHFFVAFRVSETDSQKVLFISHFILSCKVVF